MKKLINLTLHRQGEREIELAHQYGYELFQSLSGF